MSLQVCRFYRIFFVGGHLTGLFSANPTLVGIKGSYLKSEKFLTGRPSLGLEGLN
jgi:hypothetical protein